MRLAIKSVCVAMVAALTFDSANAQVALTPAANARWSMRLAPDQDGDAVSRGTTSRVSQRPTPDTETTISELAPGPPAGQDAPDVATNPFVIGGAVVAAAIFCAFAHSSSATATRH